MAYNNYAVQLEYETAVPGAFAVIGNAQSVDFPKYVTDALESTNHSSSGVRTFVASKLRGAEAFSATYICDASLITLIKTSMRAKTIENFKISGIGDFTSMLFSGFYTSFQILSADATSPEIVKVTIEIQPTGALAVT